MAEHVYANAGSYHPTVRVQDNHGLTSADYVLNVQVGEAQTGAAGAFGASLSSLVASGEAFTGLSSSNAASGCSATLAGGLNNMPELQVGMAWRERGAGEDGLLYSPVLRCQGFSDTAANTYVIAMTYDAALAADNPVCLGRYDGAAWVPAVDANAGGTPNDCGMNHPYNPDTDFVIGNFGADTASHTVWAVVKQTGDFAPMRLNLQPARVLTVISVRGDALPAAGSHSYASGTLVTSHVLNPLIDDGATQNRCQGWQMTGTPASSGTGTSCSFALNSDTTLTWLWATSYWLDLAVAGGGALSKSSGWNAAGSTVVVDAQSSYTTGLFQNWSGDTAGCTLAGTRITIPMDRARGTITAQFKRTSAQLTVVSEHPSCVPAPGSYSSPQGTPLALSASVLTDGKTQYVPSGWTMSGDAPHVGTGADCTMTLTRDSVITWKWATNYWLDTAGAGSGTAECGQRMAARRKQRDDWRNARRRDAFPVMERRHQRLCAGW